MASAERRRQLAHERALARAKKAHRAAGQKLSRLKRKGVNTTTLDTRVNPIAFHSMTTRELNAYGSKQEDFTDRRNGFTPGVKGEPLQTSSATEYRRLIRQYNAKVKRYEDQFMNEIIPGTGRTVREVLKDRPFYNFSSAQSSKRVYEHMRENLTGITSQMSLRRLIDNIRKKLSGEYFAKESQTIRKIIRDMTNVTGDNKIQEKINKLTDNQLNILVDYVPGFMIALSYRYEVATSHGEGENDPSEISAGYEDSGDTLDELVDWAGKLPENYRPSKT